MLRFNRVVGVISSHSQSTSFNKLHRLRTLSHGREVEFSRSNKTNPAFRKTQPLHIRQRVRKLSKDRVKKHGLEPLHFITLPSLAWAMALKHTDAELDLITDPDAYLMLEKKFERWYCHHFQEICVGQQ